MPPSGQPFSWASLVFCGRPTLFLNLLPHFTPLSTYPEALFSLTPQALSSLCITLKQSNSHRGLYILPISAIPGSPLDPVSAYHHMCSLTPAPPTSPAFIYPTTSGPQTLTHATFTRHLKSLVQAIGLNPSLYSGHSLRRGGCSWGFLAQVPSELLQAHGDWHSLAYLKYLSFPLTQRFSVTAQMGHLLTQTTF